MSKNILEVDEYEVFQFTVVMIFRIHQSRAWNGNLLVDMTNLLSEERIRFSQKCNYCQID